jgi:6-phosphogluconolactonase
MSRVRPTLTLAVAVLSGGLALVGPPAAQAAGSARAVYVLSNQPSGNAVITYTRAADGTLNPSGSYATGGTGTGAGLGSQGAVVVDDTESFLYAVDAGSSTLTSFRIGEAGLERVGTVSSQGSTPISVTAHGDRVYTVNAGGTGNIAGFSVTDGVLTPLASSVHPLSSDAAGPGQIAFTPDGSQLLVTEKATNRIDVFNLDTDGRPASMASVPSSGAVPFGFDFDNKGHALVSEAAASTASSYSVNPSGLQTISASVPTTENAACWLAATSNGKFAYTGNAGGSLSISGFRVQPSGSLSLLTPGGKTATTAGGVTDLATSRNSQFLYSRLGNGTIAAFQIQSDGSLRSLPVAGGLPAGTAGIAAS